MTEDKKDSVQNDQENTQQSENTPKSETTSLLNAVLEPKGSYPVGLTKVVPKDTQEAAPSAQEAQENQQSQGSAPAPEVTPAKAEASAPTDDGKLSLTGHEGTAPLNFSPPNAEKSTQANATANTAQAKADDKKQDASAKDAPAPEALGIASKTFNHMAAFAPIYLLFLFILHTAASIYFPSTYLPTELQHLELFEQIKQSGQWILPPVTDALGHAFPAYYWLMGAVDLIPMPKELFLPVLSSITAFLAIFSIYIFGACTKLNNNGAFASVLVLLASPLFLVFMHMVGPEMLTLAFFSLALGLLFRAWTRETAPMSFIFGFFFTALATLTGGFLPLWTILISSILLILWRLDIHRAHHLDAVIGFGVLIVTLAAWLVLVILTSPHASILDNFMKEAIVPFMPPYWPLQTPWWTLALLACGLVPWLVAPIFSPWLSILKNIGKSFKASHSTHSGPTWLYIVAFVGVGILILQKTDAPLAALPLLPVFGLILGKTIANFNKTGSNLFFLIFALFLLLSGIAITIISIPATAPYWESYCSAQLAASLKNIYGLPILSALFIITSLLLIRFTKRTQPQGALLVIAIFSLLVVQPFTLFVAPSLVNHYTKYDQSGNGLGTLPEFFGIAKPAVSPAPSTSAPALPEPEKKEEAKEELPQPITPEVTPPATEAPAATGTPETPQTAPATDITPVPEVPQQ